MFHFNDVLVFVVANLVNLIEFKKKMLIEGAFSRLAVDEK